MRRALYWIYLLAGIHITYIRGKDRPLSPSGFLSSMISNSLIEIIHLKRSCEPSKELSDYPHSIVCHFTLKV
jgi:hypothetical protein